MSEIFKLEATNREIVGKHVKQYRRNGQIPAVVYGPDFIPIKIFVGEPDLRHVLASAGGTHLIDLQIEGKSITTLAREVQRDSIRGNLLHVDFYHVAMDRPIRTDVPIMLIGASPAVVRREALVLQSMKTLEIEVLPRDLPDRVEVDLSGMDKVGDHILVGDLSLPDIIKVLAAPDELILKLDYAEAALTEEEVEAAAVPVSAEVEVITARKEEEGDQEES
jgi:large subunit ribosomal protein L25